MYVTLKHELLHTGKLYILDVAGFYDEIDGFTVDDIINMETKKRLSRKKHKNIFFLTEKEINDTYDFRKEISWKSDFEEDHYYKYQ